MLGTTEGREPTKAEHCKCEVENYHCRYQPVYDLMSERLTKRCFLTYAPPPATAASRQFGGEGAEREGYISFIGDYLDSPNIRRFISVAELTQKGQIHYHVYLEYINKVTFIKQVIQPLYFQGNVLPVYNPPNGGICYLFKSSETMGEYLGGSAVYTKADMHQEIQPSH